MVAMSETACRICGGDYRDKAQVRIEELEAEVERLRKALMRLANGNWNVRAAKRLTFRQYALDAAQDVSPEVQP